MTRRAAAGFARLLPLLLIAAAVLVVARRRPARRLRRLVRRLLPAAHRHRHRDGDARRRRPPSRPPRRRPPPRATTTLSAVLPARREARRRRAPRAAHDHAGHGGDEGPARRPHGGRDRPPASAPPCPRARASSASPSTATTARVDLSGAVRLGRRQPLDDGPRRAGRLHAHPVPDGALGRRSCSTASPSRRSAARASMLDGAPAPRRLARLRARHLRRVAGRRRRARQPVHPAGTASVFEGSFMARLVDSSGGASSTRPCRPRAARPAAGASPRRSPSPRRPQSGTLIVYDQSMEDGVAAGRGAHPRHLRATDDRRRAAHAASPRGETLAGSAGVTPAYVGLEPTLILPIDPPRPAIVHRREGRPGRRDARERRGASRAARAPP